MKTQQIMRRSMANGSSISSNMPPDCSERPPLWQVALFLHIMKLQRKEGA